MLHTPSCTPFCACTSSIQALEALLGSGLVCRHCLAACADIMWGSYRCKGPQPTCVLSCLLCCTRYAVNTTLGARVGRLNPSWNQAYTDETLMEGFIKAVALAGGCVAEVMLCGCINIFVRLHDCSAKS
jgi:hypothetical protein